MNHSPSTNLTLSVSTARSSDKPIDVIIIGAGISGIGMAIKLREKFKNLNLKIFERGSVLGGTWFWNSYPGAGCDIPSLMYSFSFNQNPNWSRFWAKQDEILSYIQGTAEKYKITDLITYDHECIAATWNKDTCVWMVDLKNVKSGHILSTSCRIFIGAGGVLSNPKDCPVPGKENFKGRIFHSAQWQHDAKLAGKNIVVLGNGCSATQIVPIIAKEAGHLTQFIRSPHHIVPMPLPNTDRSWLFRFMLRYIPFFQSILRFLLFLYLDWDFTLFFKDGYLPRLVRNIRQSTSLAHIKKNAPKKYLGMLLPDFDFGSKRRVLDTNYLETLHRDNVTLTNDCVVRITTNGVEYKSADGVKEVKADVIIYATGFKTEEFFFPVVMTGESGETLTQRWQRQKAGAQAYKGGYVPTFPNSCILVGPNTATGNNSIIFSSECQMTHAVQLFTPILKGTVTTITVKEEAEEKYTAWILDRMSRLIWKDGGEGGIYVHKGTGRNIAIFPHYYSVWWWMNLWVTWGDFECR